MLHAAVHAAVDVNALAGDVRRRRFAQCVASNRHDEFVELD
jgi:hypothetical protein